MNSVSLVGIIGLSFLLGATHAFDADHIMAVSSLAVSKTSRGGSMLYACKWSLGHGGVLLLVAIGAIIFGMRVPGYVSHSAEKAVGVVLIATGFSVLWAVCRRRVQLVPHQHGAMAHAHLTAGKYSMYHNHAPVFVGLIHGLAGSAPALAIVPAAMYQPWLAMAYLLVFSMGVLFGMLSFGVVLGKLQHILSKRSTILLDRFRTTLGVCAIGMGYVWLNTA